MRIRIRVCINNHPVCCFDSLKNALDHVGRQFYVSPAAREEAVQRMAALGRTTLAYGWNAATIEFIHEPV